ncbi:MAG: crossover junction endodeoxyribonuclease RuvC [Armatimonadetes bacterium]|nr:crossover junction endodeoxyribonuclease RuvC [Armatimonadota bacterium]
MPTLAKTTVLALDPGLRDLGYAVLRGRRLQTAGVRPLRLIPKDRRIAEARRLVRGWIAAYRPGTLVLESTHRHSIKWLNEVDRLGRSIRRLARRCHLEVRSYAPQTVRKTVLGNGRATKREAAVAVATRFPRLRIYLTQDRKWKERYWLNLFDAVALALHHRDKGR